MVVVVGRGRGEQRWGRKGGRRERWGREKVSEREDRRRCKHWLKMGSIKAFSIMPGKPCVYLNWELFPPQWCSAD